MASAALNRLLDENQQSAHQKGLIPWAVVRVTFSRPMPAPASDRVALHRAGANGLGPLPAFSAAEVLMHPNDDEGSVEPIDVDLAFATAPAVHGQGPDPDRAHVR